MPGEQEAERLKTVTYDYHLANSFACLLAAMFFTRLTTEPGAASVVFLSNILSVVLYGFSVLLLIFMLISKVKKIEAFMTKVIDTFGNWAAGALGATSVTMAFIELLLIFTSSIAFDKMTIFFLVLGFLILYFTLILLKLQWDKELLLLRLKITAIMLVGFAFGNLIWIYVSGQFFTLIRDTLIYLGIALVCLFIDFAFEYSNKAKVKQK